MTSTTRLMFYVIGALLIALPGLFTTSRRFTYLACMIPGLVLIAAAGKRELTKPKTALSLLIVSNCSLWLSVALWLLRDELVGIPPRGPGVDPFVGPLLLWFAVLLVLTIYETIVFTRAVVRNRDRTLAAVGLAAVVIQVLVSGGSIYLMIQGV